jgi:zinc protease
VTTPETDVDPRGGAAFPIEDTQLSNGLKLVLQPDPKSEICALVFCVPAGRRTEREGQEGVSHFLEHGYSLGSEKLGPREFDRVVRELGGAKNAFTHYDYTSFHVAVPSAGLARIIELEADRFSTLKLSPEDLACELKVVKEERLRGEHVPSTRLYETLLRAAYAVHPYGKPIIGTAQDLEHLEAGKVRTYYAEHYVPPNATFVISGGFDPTDAVARFESAFGALPARSKPTLEIRAEPEQAGERRTIMDGRVNDGAMLSVVYKGPGFDSPDAAALVVLGQALAGGRASLMYRRLVREKRVASNVGGGWWALRDPSPICFGLRAQDGLAIETLESAFLETIAEIQERGLSQQEIDRVRAQLHLSAWSHAESALGRAARIARAEMTSDLGWRFGSNYTARLQEITGADVARVAREYLVEAHRTIAHALTAKATSPMVAVFGEGNSAPVSGPLAAADSAPSSEVIGTDPGAVSTAVSWVKPQGSAPTEQPFGEGAYRLALPNGVVLLHLASDRLPLFAVCAYVRSGSVYDFDGRHGLSALTGDLMTRGTARLDEEALSIAFADMGTALAVNRGIELTKFRTGMGTADLLPGMRLFAEVLQRPRFDGSTFERIKAQWLTGWRRGTGRASRLLRVAGLRTVYSGHPYSWPAGGTETGISAIRGDDVHRFHRETVRPERTAIAIAGAFDRSPLVDAIWELFGGWHCEEAARQPVLERPAAPPGARIVLIDLPEQRQAHIQMMERLSLPYGDHDWNAIWLFDSILGGDGLDSRLPARIRTKEGLTYSIGSFLESDRLDGVFGMRAQTSAENCGRVVDLMLEELERLIDGGIGDAELQGVRARILARNAFRDESLVARASGLAVAEMFELGPDHAEESTRVLTTIQKEEIEATVRRRIRARDLSIIVVGRKDEILPQLEKRGAVKIVTAKELDVA